MKPTSHQFYGRRKSRPLRPSRQKAMETVLPQIKIQKPEQALDFSFHLQSICLEIGFGNGDSLAAWHRANPDTAYIGCEPFINGLSNLCKLIEKDDLKNIRIWNDMAQPLLEALPDQSLDTVYLLNPDPWPKKRHHRRRFVQKGNLDHLARILKSSGQFIATTDHADLADWMLEETLRHGAFEWTARCQADWQTPPDGWLATRYEGKGTNAGRRQVYLIFRKICKK